MFLFVVIYVYMNIYSRIESQIPSVHAGPNLTLDDAESLSELFSTLSDPTRVRIISLLASKDQSVQELSEALQISHSAVSHQLSGLRLSRVVRASKSGRSMIYSLHDQHIEQLYLFGLEHIRHK